MHIAIFGPGRVGKSFCAYALSIGAQATLLSRADAAEGAVARADLVVVAIPDDALTSWLDHWRARLADKRAIHFSGARVIAGLPGYHPLYSFPATPLSPSEFGRIAIAREPGAAPFAAIVPGATNPEFIVKNEDRALYHALAVVSGNFAAHLWNETAAAFTAHLGPNAGAAMGAYLDSVVARFRENPSASLTGPLARRDGATVRANLDALVGEPRLLALYRAFLQSAWPDWEK